MTFIFSKLDGLHAILAMAFSRLGVEVYYTNLSACNSQENKIESLSVNGVLPLPIEVMREIDEWQHYININSSVKDKDSWLFDYLPDQVVATQKKLYPNIDDLNDKLRIALKTNVDTSVSGKVSAYARANSNSKHYYISSDIFSLLMPMHEDNVRAIFIPDFSFIPFFVRKIFGVIINKFQNTLPDVNEGNNDFHNESSVSFSGEKVAYIVHDGLNYGDLYQKDLFYSSKDGSPFNKNRLLHISYSGYYNSSKSIQWFNLSRYNIGRASQFISALKSIRNSIFSVRSIKHIFGMIILMFLYMRFARYKKSLSLLPSLKLVLIDYEILCPKSLLLALDSLGIITVAVQERYFMSFYSSFGTFLDYYMCSSDFSEKCLKQNSSYIVKNYIPIGLHRSDLIRKGNLSLPAEIETAKNENKKIIVALGFHTPLLKHQSATDPILSWSAHIAFIEDILTLAGALDNAFIVLRYKFIDWLELPVFSDIVKRLNAMANVTISTEYTVEYYSYQLCSEADLVIAKHTSLGDECLSRGIPVLFHDYTHNLKKIVSSVYDYDGSKIVCHDYSQLLSMSKKILSSTTDECDTSNLYGSYNDGHVRERVHEWLEKKLDKMHEQ